MLNVDPLLIQELENQILGILILKPEMFMIASLDVEDFVINPLAYEIIQDQYYATGTLNTTNLAIQFSAKGLEQWLPSEFVSSVVTITNFENLCQIVKGHSMRRKAILRAQEVISLANDMSANHDASVTMLQGMSAELVRSDSIIGQTQILSDMRSNGVVKENFATGLTGLDALMGGGMFRGKVYGFSGKAKSGKTLLASTISYNLGENGCRHLYVAMEMGATEIAQRKFARKGKFNSLEFIQGKRTWEGLTPNTEIRYLDAPGITFNELKSRLLEAVARHQITGAIIDYWQLVQGQDSRQTEEKHLRDVAQGLADFAKRHNIWIFLLSQTNEEGKTFAGQGLIKACDQLYMIHGTDDTRWLEMTATRYTERMNYGSDDNPSLAINKRVGPYFEEI
ncbi:DnaB-like helicase C-terminal domain-containing protein [Dyadobacter bucti]|uniref:DnaB-like helicase C-terminal domain-containing protein n=1 Tax=Dyadobacter bucti TaxID=2572203 RepID=UPI00110849C3|nr:DnaB-like helicase C-terminal domain-containing protein [Dyadobacter bucti]